MSLKYFFISTFVTDMKVMPFSFLRHLKYFYVVIHVLMLKSGEGIILLLYYIYFQVECPYLKWNQKYTKISVFVLTPYNALIEVLSALRLTFTLLPFDYNTSII